MVIEIPGCNFRIKGADCDWQVQCKGRKKDGGEGDWASKYFFPSLDYAVGKAYELMLMGKGKSIDIRELPDECRKTKESLLRAVRKAVKE